MSTSHRPQHQHHVPRVPDGQRPHANRPQRTWLQLALRAAGAGLLVATGAIHLDLYLTGYRTIPTIGVLFLLQVIAAFVLAAVVGVLGSRLAAVAGALFALSTLGGYLLSIWFGLFGFREVRTTAGIVAGVIEVAAFAVLAALALAPGPQHAMRGPRMARVRDGLPGALAAVGGVSALALVLLGVAVARPPPPAKPPCPIVVILIGSVRPGPEDNPDQGRDRAHQRQGHDAVLVRAGHLDEVGLLRELRCLLAAGI
jgi:hypothetical protein